MRYVLRTAFFIKLPRKNSSLTSVGGTSASLTRLGGRLKAAWVVLPLSSSVAAIPENASAKAMLRLLLTFARSKFIKRVLPVPPEENYLSPT